MRIAFMLRVYNKPMRNFILGFLLGFAPQGAVAPTVTTWPPMTCYSGTLVAPGGEVLPAPAPCPPFGIALSALPANSLAIGPLSDGTYLPVQVVNVAVQSGAPTIPAFAGVMSPTDPSWLYAFRVQPFQGGNVPIWGFAH